jgi:5-methylcytosine-specific restriction endonuclease McrA
MAKRKNITARQVIDLLKRQGYRCAISGRQLTPETASLDHIVPLGRGGEHGIANVCIVDHRVNIAKGTMTLEEFVSLCRDVVECQDHKPAADGVAPIDMDVLARRTVPPPPSLF